MAFSAHDAFSARELERWRIQEASSLGPEGVLMGILNVTPDSFSDGGQLASTDDVVARARACGR
jgi:dihydropteroate synthase